MNLLRRSPVWVALVLIFLLVQEFAIRMAFSELDPTQQLAFTANADGIKLGLPNTVHRQIKNSGDYNVQVRFNALGLREAKPIDTATPEDFYLVGDSFVFGWGVVAEQRLGEQLDALIDPKVFSLGSPGNLDTYEQLIKFAEKHGGRAKRIIFAINEETDITNYDVRAEEKPVLDAPLPATEPRGFSFIYLKVLLTQHSAIYQAITRLVHQMSWLREAAVRLGLVAPNLSATESKVSSTANIRQTVARAVTLAKKYNATMLLIPSRYLWFGEFRDDISHAHDELVAGLRAENVDLLDLRPLFEAAGQPLKFHFEHDGHWRPEGHAVAAEALADHLKARYGDAL